MHSSDNPLIATDTYTTLLHAKSVISFLQDFYCLGDIPGKKPPRCIDEEVYTGLYFIMNMLNQALSFEIERLQECKGNKN